MSAFQESPSHSDLAEASLSSTDSPLQDNMIEVEKEIEKETEVELEECGDEYEDSDDEFEDSDDEFEDSDDDLEEEIEDEYEEIAEDIVKETLQEFDYLSDFDEASLSSTDSPLQDIMIEVEKEIEKETEVELEESGDEFEETEDGFEDSDDGFEDSDDGFEDTEDKPEDEIEEELQEETEDEPEEEIEEELQEETEDELGDEIEEELGEETEYELEETEDELEEEIEEELEEETADELEEEINDALEAAITQQQEYRANLNKLTSENNHVASENKRLQGELEDAVQQHQKDREACSRLEEQVKTEKDRFLRVNKELERLKKAQADREALMYDKETLSLQNNDITGKLEAMEAKCKETVSEKDEIIFKNQVIIVELRHSVEEFRIRLTTQQANGERKKAQIKELLNQQQKDTDQLNNLTNDNQQLASKNMRLQGELEDALNEMQLARDAALSEQFTDRLKIDSLTRVNQEVASENKKLRSERVDPLRETTLAHEADLSKQRIDDLIEENHHLASKSKLVQGELEAALNSMSHVRQAALIERQEYRTKLDNVKMKNIKPVSEKRRPQAELKDAQTQQSDSKRKQAQLEDTLHQEQIQRAVLEDRLSNTASTLEKPKKKTVHLAYALKTEKAKKGQE